MRAYPQKNSLIYLAIYKNSVIGYYHIPIFNFKFENKFYKIGQIETVAILKPYRKYNVFKNLAIFANEDANNKLDIIYTFPNKKSIHTFIKYNNYLNIGSFPVYILPTNMESIISSKIKLFGLQKLIGSIINWYIKKLNKSLGKDEKIISISSFDEKTENLFDNYSKDYKFSLHKDRSFLKWRYLNRPNVEYKIAGLKSNSILNAVVVYKKDVILNNDCIIILDVAFNDISSLNKLLCQLTSFESRNNPNFNSSFIFISGFIKNIKKLKYSGFIRVPKFMNPRNLNLLVKNIRVKHCDGVDDKSVWSATLGDWDVFFKFNKN